LEREPLRKREEIRLGGRENDVDRDSYNTKEDNKSIDRLSGSDSFGNISFSTSSPSRHVTFIGSSSSSSPSSSSSSQNITWGTSLELLTPFLPPYLCYLQKRREYLLQETHRNLGYYYLDIFVYTPAFYHSLFSNFDPFFVLCFLPQITQKSSFLILHHLHYQVC
jgi:hypothetical protein